MRRVFSRGAGSFGDVQGQLDCHLRLRARCGLGCALQGPHPDPPIARCRYSTSSIDCSMLCNFTSALGSYGTGSVHMHFSPCSTSICSFAGSVVAIFHRASLIDSPRTCGHSSPRPTVYLGNDSLPRSYFDMCRAAAEGVPLPVPCLAGPWRSHHHSAASRPDPSRAWTTHPQCRATSRSLQCRCVPNTCGPLVCHCVPHMEGLRAFLEENSLRNSNALPCE